MVLLGWEICAVPETTCSTSGKLKTKSCIQNKNIMLHTRIEHTLELDCVSLRIISVTDYHIPTLRDLGSFSFASLGFPKFAIIVYTF